MKYIKKTTKVEIQQGDSTYCIVQCDIAELSCINTSTEFYILSICNFLQKTKQLYIHTSFLGLNVASPADRAKAKFHSDSLEDFSQQRH